VGAASKSVVGSRKVWLARQLARRASRLGPERRVRATFREAAERWYAERGHEKGWSPSTRRDYPLGARRPPASGVRRRSAREDHAGADRGVANRGHDAVRRRGRGPLRAAASQDGTEDARAILHGIFEHARKAYGLQRNPSAEVEQIRHTYSGSFDFYSPEEVWALVRAAESDQDAAIFLTASFAGLRRGEVVALRVRDVDFANRVVRVEGSYGLGVLKAPKSGKVRSVPMAGEVEQALARLLLERGDPGPTSSSSPERAAATSTPRRCAVDTRRRRRRPGYG
jgi:integrase